MTDRRSRTAKQWAWAISVAVHGLAFAAGVWAVSRPTGRPSVPKPSDAGLIVMGDPVDHEPLHFSLVEPPLPSAVRPEPIDLIEPVEPDPAPVPDPVPAGPPVVRAPRPVPSPLAGLIGTMVRDLGDRPPAAVPVSDVVNLQHVAATDVSQAVADTIPTTVPSIRAVPTSPPTGASPFGGGSPVHGELPAGRSIVYVLDCSGTMGLDGKLDRARAAVLATLAAQADGVTVRVVTYSGRATLLDRTRLVAELSRLEPAGASRHAEGARAALKFDPDYVVLFTDATDADLADVRPVLRGTRHPVALSVARVSAAGVMSPVEFH